MKVGTEILNINISSTGSSSSYKRTLVVGEQTVTIKNETV
jgi:hypothetical protein